MLDFKEIDIDTLKEFLSKPEIQELINNDEWQEVFDKFENTDLKKNWMYSNSSYLYELLLKSDVDPLPYLEKVGKRFFSGTSITNFKWPEGLGVAAWSWNIFEYCDKLVSADLSNFPDDKLVDEMFEDCIKLENIIIPEHVLGIGRSCFSRCTSLKQIKLPSNLKNLGFRSFSDCSSLEQIEIPNNVNLEANQLVGNGAIFVGCKSLKKILYKGKEYTSVSALVKEIRSNQYKHTKEWFRVKYGGRSLLCYELKNGIKCNMVLDGFMSSNQTACYFASEDEAKEFIRKNNYYINGWKVDESGVYKARLTSADTGFIKVSTMQGDVYINSNNAHRLGISANKSTIIPA